jgi:hypothetical protein
MHIVYSVPVDLFEKAMFHSTQICDITSDRCDISGSTAQLSRLSFKISKMVEVHVAASPLQSHSEASADRLLQTITPSILEF